MISLISDALKKLVEFAAIALAVIELIVDIAFMPLKWMVHEAVGG